MNMNEYKEVVDENGNVTLVKVYNSSGFANRWQLKDKIGELEVSTVFLSLDHNFYADDNPLVYETMVFGGKLDGEQERYHTRAEAIIGHQKMIERVRNEH